MICSIWRGMHEAYYGSLCNVQVYFVNGCALADSHSRENFNYLGANIKTLSTGDHHLKFSTSLPTQLKHSSQRYKAEQQPSRLSRGTRPDHTHPIEEGSVLITDTVQSECNVTYVQKNIYAQSRQPIHALLTSVPASLYIVRSAFPCATGTWTRLMSGHSFLASSPLIILGRKKNWSGKSLFHSL